MTFTIRKSYLYVSLALIIGLFSGFGVAKIFLGSAQALPLNQPSALQQPFPMQVSIEGRPYIGPEDAPVTIVEFTDYQCPFCGEHVAQVLPQLLREYKGQIKYVVRNYPLSSIHPFAQKAGEAAECAYDQGKFWEYRELLFQNQQALETKGLKKYARDLGLDINAFDTCLDSGAKAQVVARDFQDGQTYGVGGTPTFFINGQRLVGAQPFARFKTWIDAELGTPR